MSVVDALNLMAPEYDVTIIVLAHPRIRKRLNVLKGVTLDNRVGWIKPFSFHDFDKPKMQAFCAISDSGILMANLTSFLRGF